MMMSVSDTSTLNVGTCGLCLFISQRLFATIGRKLSEVPLTSYVPRAAVKVSPVLKSGNLLSVCEVLRIAGCSDRRSRLFTLHEHDAVVASCENEETWLRTAEGSAMFLPFDDLPYPFDRRLRLSEGRACKQHGDE